MSYAIRNDGQGFRAVEREDDCRADETWSPALPEPSPTPEHLSMQVAVAVDAKLDALARQWQYRDYVSARSYVGDMSPKFSAEGAAIAAYGSACWTLLDQLASAVEAGSADIPSTVDEVLALLPPEPVRPTV